MLVMLSLVYCSSDATVKVVSAMGQFICYHPPEETFYENSKVTLYVVDLYVVSLVPITASETTTCQ